MHLAAKAVGLQMQGDTQGEAIVIREALAEHVWPVGLQAKLMFFLCLFTFRKVTWWVY